MNLMVSQKPLILSPVLLTRAPGSFRQVLQISDRSEVDDYQHLLQSGKVHGWTDHRLLEHLVVATVDAAHLTNHETLGEAATESGRDDDVTFIDLGILGDLIEHQSSAGDAAHKTRGA